MKAKRIFTYKPSLSVAIFCIVSLSAGFLLGQTAPAPTWVTDDWSQHHLVFSNPGTMTNAVSTGTLAHWSSITNDLRYQIQQRKRSGTQQAAAATPGWVVATPTPIPTPKGQLKKDWSTTLSGVVATLTGTVGTLSTSSIGGSSTLTVDGVTFDASPPTAATATGTFTGNPANAQTVTIGGTEVLTASLSTAASQTGTFTSLPTSSSAITVVNGSNTLTLKTNATAASVVGTAAGTPAANTTASVTSGTNTLTLSNGGTAASVGGTFGTGTPYYTDTIHITGPLGTAVLTSNGTRAQSTATFSTAALSGQTVTLTPSSGSAISMTPGGGAAQMVGNFTSASAVTGTLDIVYSTSNGSPNTLALTPGPSVATSASSPILIVGRPGASGDTFVINGTTYQWESSSGGCSPSPSKCVSRASGGSNTQYATNLANAINGSCFNTCTADASVTAGTVTTVGSNGSFTITANTAGTGPNSYAITTNDGTNENVNGLSTASISTTLGAGTGTLGANAVTNGCTSSAAGTFVNSGGTANAQAVALYNAITSCHSSYSTIGVTAGYPGGSGTSVTLTADAPGSAISIAPTGTSATNFNWTGGTGTHTGTDGTASCSSFVNTGNTTTLAGNINTALGNCSGITTSTSTNTVTVFTTATGTGATLTNLGGTASVSWGTTTSQGSNGTQAGTCASGAGNYGLSGTPATTMGFVVTAINACTTSTGVTATTGSGGAFTVTAQNPGAFTFNTTGTSVTNSTFFNWGTVTAGTNGSGACTSSTTGTYATSNVTATLASNISTAIYACNNSFPAVGATSSYTSGNTFTVTDTTPGAFTFSVGGGATGILTWGTVTAGTPGSNTCTSSTTGTFATSSATTTLASNLSAAINLCPTGTGLTATSTYNGSSVTVTASTWGTSSVTLTPTSGFFAWNAGTLAGGTNGTNTGTSFAINNVNADAATNLAAAITRNGSTVGVTATSSGAVVTVTATAGSGGNNVTLAEGLSNFTWSGSGLTGGTDGTNSATTFAYWSVNTYVSSAQVAANIASAINTNTTLQAITTGVSATSGTSGSNGTVTIAANAAGTGGDSYAVSESGFSAWTGTGDLSGGGVGTTAARVQPNTYPAKFSFDTSSALCSNFVVYPTGATGSSSAANIIAYNNIYSGCSGAVPAAYWAYNTGGAVSTSPILSFDSTGSQVAYIQVSGTTASLVILKWAANPSASVGTPVTLTAQSSGSAYQTCAAPCMYTIAFNGGHSDTFSSPFYDYHDDTIYVGDDSGYLHQFTGVFNGAPAENTTSPWPEKPGGNELSSPVYDYSTQSIFVGDLGGIFYNLSSGGVLTNSGQIADAFADAPLVDSTNSTVYAFATTGVGSTHDPGSNVVFQFDQFSPSTPTGFVAVGTGANNGGYYLYAGTFDNAYYSTGNPASGSLYVVGNTGVTTGGVLYRIPILRNAMGTPVTAATVTGAAHPWPSPVTEFCNPGTNSACALQTATCSWSANSATITCSGSTFSSSYVGAFVTGTNIPNSAYFAGTVSGHSDEFTISPTPTAAGSGVSLTIGVTSTGTDYLFFSVNRGTATNCTSSTNGNGCVASYNASYPGSVPVVGGFNITPITSGCWATGGMIIDNGVASGTEAGASQIYYVNLNTNGAGNNSAVSTSCTAGSVSIINGVQLAQGQ